MKKYYLDIGFDDDFLLFGLVSAELPHRIAWLINDQLHFNFIRQEDITLFDEKGTPSYHARFDYQDEINRLSFYMTGNKDESAYLIPELSKIDYFLIVRGALEFFKEKKFISSAKQIEQIRLISKIDPGHLKSKYNLIIPELTK